jgi:argininosuccinate lyase
MREAEPRIDESVYTVLGVEKSVSSRTSFGGTAPDNVRAQAQLWLERLGREIAG